MTGETAQKRETRRITGCALASKDKVEGNAVGLVNNTTESLEFTAETSELKFAGEPATLVGTTKQELVNDKNEPNGKLQVIK
jgi:hypothetical protein